MLETFVVSEDQSRSKFKTRLKAINFTCNSLSSTGETAHKNLKRPIYQNDDILKRRKRQKSNK